MAEANDVYGIIHQNLIDAGCNEQTTEQCMTFVKDENISGMLPILSKHRSLLLDSVHTGQKQIDCLDYLIYQIKKGKL